MDIKNLPLETLKELERSANEAVRKIRDERENVERAEADIRLDKLKPLAIRSHDLLCSWDHCSGCGWGYEMEGTKHHWTGWAHNRWLKWVDGLVNGTNEKPGIPFSEKDITEMLDMVESFKKLNRRALYLIRSGINGP